MRRKLLFDVMLRALCYVFEVQVLNVLHAADMRGADYGCADQTLQLFDAEPRLKRGQHVGG